MDKSNFNIYRNSGFQLKFENGLKVSVMFGQGHYCNTKVNQPFPMDMLVSSQTAEVAILNDQDQDLNLDFLVSIAKQLNLEEKFREEELVFCYITSDEVAKIINLVPTLK